MLFRSWNIEEAEYHFLPDRRTPEGIKQVKVSEMPPKQ